MVASGGLGGFVGSVVGAGFGVRGNSDLFAGGVIGGLLASAAAGWLAAKLAWIDSGSAAGAAIGAAVGFLAAAAIAVNTLSTPIGALLSPVLVGAGGLAGARFQSRRRRQP